MAARRRRRFPSIADHDGRTARAAVHAGIRQEITAPLEAQAERRCDHGLPHDRQVVEIVVKSERKPGDQDGFSGFGGSES